MLGLPRLLPSFEMRVIIFSSASSREMACDELPISKALHTSTATNHGSFSIRAVRISPNCSFLKTSILLSMIDFLSGIRCATLIFEGRNGIAAVGTLCKHAGLIFPVRTVKAAASALRENAIRAAVKMLKAGCGLHQQFQCLQITGRHAFHT